MHYVNWHSYFCVSRGEDKMKTYLEPKMDVELFGADVIVTSAGETPIDIDDNDFGDFWG